MIDSVYAGATWRRTVNLADANGPVDPTDITAVLCPEIRMTVNRLSVGMYELELTEDQTGPLTTGETHWEMWGRIGADMAMITRQPLYVLESCGP